MNNMLKLKCRKFYREMYATNVNINQEFFIDIQKLKESSLILRNVLTLLPYTDKKMCVRIYHQS